MKPTTRKARPSYFQRNIQSQGENFLDQMNADRMQKDAIRVFRDLAMGNIKIETEGQFFFNVQFLESCITAAYSKLILHTTHYNGVALLVTNGIEDATTQSVLAYDKLCSEAYSIIHTNLIALQNTGDLNYLTVMVNNLQRYKYNI